MLKNTIATSFFLFSSPILPSISQDVTSYLTGKVNFERFEFCQIAKNLDLTSSLHKQRDALLTVTKQLQENNEEQQLVIYFSAALKIYRKTLYAAPRIKQLWDRVMINQIDNIITNIENDKNKLSCTYDTLSPNLQAKINQKLSNLDNTTTLYSSSRIWHRKNKEEIIREMLEAARKKSTERPGATETNRKRDRE